MVVLAAFGLASAVLLSLALPADDLLAIARGDRALAVSILVELRLPRTLLAAIYGAVLGASGAAIQALFGNPLASPDITGTSGGAALGAVVAAYLLGATTPWGRAAVLRARRGPLGDEGCEVEDRGGCLGRAVGRGVGPGVIVADRATAPGGAMPGHVGPSVRGALHFGSGHRPGRLGVGRDGAGSRGGEP